MKNKMERIGNLIKATPKPSVTSGEAETGPPTKKHPSPRIRCSLFDHPGHALVDEKHFQTASRLPESGFRNLKS
jgi:hypothetical protein